MPPVTSEAPQTFRVAVGADLSLFKQPFRMAHAAQYEDGKGLELKDPGIRPYRYSKEIWIPIGTHKRKNPCTLTLTLGALTSKPRLCREIEDNALTAFHFDSFIKPGIYRAQISSDRPSPAENVSIYAIQDDEGDYWLHPRSPGKRILVGQALWVWAKAHPGRCLLFATMLLVVCIIITSGLWMKSFLPLVAATVLGTITITPALSGHDETAHLDLFALQTREVISKAGRAAPSKMEIRKSIFELYLNEDFYRLHMTAPMKKGDCPHKVTGLGCGHNSVPRKYYGQVANLLFSNATQQPTVIELTFIGRAINATLIMFALLSVFVTLGRSALEATGACLILASGLIAQIASVTNDVPAYALGILLASGIGASISGVSWIRRIVVLIISGLLIALVPTPDANWTSAYPVYALLVIATIIGRKASAAGTVPWSAIRHVIVTSLSFFSVLLFVSVLRADIAKILRSNLKMLRFLTKTNLDLSRWIEGTYWNLKSLIGSFIWGHSYYDAVGFVVAFACILYCTVLLFKRHWRASRKGNYGISAFLGVSAAAYCIMVAIIMLRWRNANLPIDTISKPRFLAAAWGIPLLPVWLIIYDRGMPERYRTPAKALVCLSAYLLLSYYLPQFCIADRY